MERKIDGIFRPNMLVMTASNYAGTYIQNIDYEDDAFRRRQIFIEYMPNKEDITTYMTEHNYHPTIREIVEQDSFALSYLIDHETTQELEQTTQLGSWALLNDRWKYIEEKEGYNMEDYKLCKEDILIFGSYYFNESTKKEILNTLSMLEELNTIDIQKEVIENNGLNVEGYVMHDKKGKVYDYQKRRNELFVKAKFYVKNNIFKDKKYLDKNVVNVAKVFANRPELLLSLILDIEKECEKLAKKDSKYQELHFEIASKIYTVMKEEAKNDPIVEKAFKNICDGASLLHQSQY